MKTHACRLVGIALLAIARNVVWAGTPELPRPNHVVIVIEENRSFSSMIGNKDAPYINALAKRGALFTQSFGLMHPSQPNYIMLLAGSPVGVANNSIPPNLPFTVPNMAAELLARNLTFAGYSEDLPEPGFAGERAGDYVRKHNAWVNWQGASSNAIPPACNLPFSAWPTNLALLPTVSFVVPNLLHDIHDGTLAEADDWLRDHLDAYVQWAQTHNSLLIFTFDEDDHHENQRIPTFFVGPMVRPGQYDRRVTHYEILRTVEECYGLPPSGEAAKTPAISDCWVK